MLPRSARSAFTLVELTIVIAILAILAALVLPKISDASDESAETAIEVNLAQIESAIGRYHALNGSYPATIDPGWFVGGQLPDHPFATDANEGVEVWLGDATQSHPAQKFLTAGAKAWWYNPGNGKVRARVENHAVLADRLAAYNRANAANITDAAQLQ